MNQKRELINLTITNNSNSVIAIPLFQRNVASINATTKYSYDITVVDLSCGTASIDINSVLYSVTFDTTLQGLIDALNALGFGLFGVEGSLFLFTTDDTNVYGNLNICGGGGTTTTTSTTTSTTTAASTTTTSTTTSTTTAASTTTTSTTTTTTTAAPSFNASEVSGVAACTFTGGWSGNCTFSGGDNTFCGGTGVTIVDNLAAFDAIVGNNGTFYLSDSTNVRQYQRNGLTYNATQIGSCVSC